MESAFSYQGRLNEGSTPANGTYVMRFALVDAAVGGSLVAPPITNNAVQVENGLFTVRLDFGIGVFDGAGRWLEVAVRTNAPGSILTTLTPPQPLLAAPYSLYAVQAKTAANAGTVSAGAVAAPQLATPAVPAAGQVLTYNGTSLVWSNSGSVPGAWLLGGNTGTTPGSHFLGTTDNRPLELRARNQRALRIEPNTSGAPNLIGGSERNFIPAGVVGAVIGGGGAVNYAGQASSNTVAANFATIGGGSANWLSPEADSSFIGGGQGNLSESAATVIGGGDLNYIGTNSPDATIGGGYANTIEASAFDATIGGGYLNYVSDSVYDGVIGGGYANYLGWNAVSSVIGGGFTNTIEDSASYSFIGGGTNNLIRSASEFSVIAGGEENYIGTNGFNNTVSGGGLNAIASVYGGAIGGGFYNTLEDYADYATVGGGYDNLVQRSAAYATIPGGQNAACLSYGQMAYASGSSARYGDAQASLYVLRNATTNAVQAELFLDGRSERMHVPTSGTWTYHIQLVARSANGSSASYEAKGGVKNISGNLSLVGTTSPGMTVLASEIANLPIPQVQADTANRALVLKVTGVTGQSIHWVARVQTTEIIF
jgi:hypothetical protein